MLKIKTIKSAGLILVTFTAVLFMMSKTVSAEEKPALNKTVLLAQELELSSKNVNTKIIRVIFPVAFKTPWHTHEGPGPRYVVKGKLKVIEGGKTNTYSVGDVFWESGDLMSVENVGEEAAELIIFELASAK
ncbi:cupin domain-containing protein [Methylobacter psychrophilus]|jgi:quercetin dioxygenase-like cupin family protein|uniref:cupin domain-containing protein n=1 Tax=Methylobacter psychrophilus TaxID=96941 RepID=UPI0021D4D093|nr:cupin domain-containing protein [Methylobacter psychrophilus]